MSLDYIDTQHTVMLKGRVAREVSDALRFGRGADVGSAVCRSTRATN